MNAPTIGAEIPLPFGGTKHTGNGFREAGTRGIEQFSQVKTVYVDYSGRLQQAQIDNRTRMAGATMTALDTTAPARRPTDWLARYDAARWPACCRATSTSSPSGPRARGSSTSTGAASSTSASGIAVTNTGHCHPRVVAAIEAQVAHADPHVGRSRTTSATSSWPSASAASCPFFDRRRRCSSATPGRGGRRRDQAGPPGHRSAGHHRLPPRLPRPHARRRRRSPRPRRKYREGYEPLLGGVTIAPYAYPLRTAARRPPSRARRARRAARRCRRRRGNDRRR